MQITTLKTETLRADTNTTPIQKAEGKPGHESRFQHGDEADRRTLVIADLNLLSMAMNRLNEVHEQLCYKNLYSAMCEVGSQMVGIAMAIVKHVDALRAEDQLALRKAKRQQRETS